MKCDCYVSRYIYKQLRHFRFWYCLICYLYIEVHFLKFYVHLWKHNNFFIFLLIVIIYFIFIDCNQGSFGFSLILIVVIYYIFYAYFMFILLCTNVLYSLICKCKLLKYYAQDVSLFSYAWPFFLTFTCTYNFYYDCHLLLCFKGPWWKPAHDDRANL